MPDAPDSPAQAPLQLGILGGGQLGLMLAQALVNLSLDLVRPVALRFLDRSPACPATATHWPVLTGSLEDPATLGMFGNALDLVTYESENIPPGVLEILGAQGARSFPGLLSLIIGQDRLTEKDWLNGLGIPTAPYAPVASRDDLDYAVAAIGLPGILKTRRFGYDGKGQAVIHDGDGLDEAWRAVAGAPCVYEGMVTFTRELSQISVRAQDGAIVHYPLTENQHEGGILRRSAAPAIAPENEWPEVPAAPFNLTEGIGPLSLISPITPMIPLTSLPPGAPAQAHTQARAFLERLLPAIDHIGTLALELFELEDGSLIANEIAPRVHNSGHWTIEACVCSQFENHLRAGLGLPLGSTDFRSGITSAEMMNFLGTMPDEDQQKKLTEDGWTIHDYRKKPAPGRKVGHATRVVR